MVTMNKYYNALEKVFAKADVVGQISSILSWDTSTMMPKGSSESRGEQMAYLDGHVRSIIFNKKVRDDLSEAHANIKVLDDWQKANLKAMQRQYDYYASVPAKLQRQRILACNRSEITWREARENNNFQIFLPIFTEVVQLTKSIATHRGDYVGNKNYYETLVDLYDPGRKLSEIDSAFAKLSAFLPSFIENVGRKQASLVSFAGSFDTEKQKTLVTDIMKAFCFNFDAGRLDTSTHPFCGGYASDIRITTRYNPNNLFSGLYGVIHETGHALYEQNRPHKWITQPVSSSIGMAMHESQSLFAENQIGLSKSFIQFLQPKLTKLFDLDKAIFSVDGIYNHLTHVAPSFIRVEADEVTYPLHIIMRYNLEKQLMSGEIRTQDIPEAWNKESTEKLGITPPNDALGCLQDIHWAFGGFGYFPSYTLGAMTAAQLMHKIRSVIPDIDHNIASGNFKEIYAWLRTNIHSQGSLFGSANQLLQEATDEQLNPDYFINYLKDRYA